MIAPSPESLAGLYEADETAWLDAMAELIRRGDLAALDYPHLAEYLADMAGRDRREVRSRLTVLLAHLLKWTHQPGKRTRSWRRTIVVQQQELSSLLAGRSLRNHAGSILATAYADAVARAALETDLPKANFPAECPHTVDHLIGREFLDQFFAGPSDGP